jgi:energy-coupling factor transporter transmembrane protein EcfT
VRLGPGPAAALLAGLGAAALLADRWQSVLALTLVLLAVCLRAPRGRRRVYLGATLVSSLGLFLLSPLTYVYGSHPLWTGPTLPVLGPLDVTTEELGIAAVQALRLAAVGLAFAAYALLLDHDRLVQGTRLLRRSALAVALATRLVPTLERDAVGLVEALRGRGLGVEGVRGRARLLSPLVGGSLERGLNLAEAMEARGYGRAGRTRAPRPRSSALDRSALPAAVALVLAGALWL